MNNKWRLLIIYAISIWSCNQGNNQNILKDNQPSSDLGVRYANGFTIDHSDHSTVLTVKNPWQHASGIEYKYVLSDTIDNSYRLDDFTWVIKTPVKKVICLSTTHIGLISFIGADHTVSGVSGQQYVVNATVRNGIDGNEVFDVGYDEGLNYEMILRIRPDVVFAYGVSVSVTNTVRKLNELGIPVILIGEYLESDPLGKMEWVKAIAACYGTEERIAAKFDSVASRYTELIRLASSESDKPEVMLGLPWRGTWYVSGAQSYVARLISNSGGNYIWRNLDFNESRPLGLEMIYEKSLTADYWINPGEARTKAEIISIDERFQNLPALLNDRVFNNDKRMSPGGGNDFFETGVVEPDIILADLITILQPHLLPSHKLKYYRKVN